jgi:hypothetical protein
MIRRHLTYANVMATLAVFIALGGTGYAVTALPRNSVGPRQLRRHAVSNAKLAPRAVTASRVKDDALSGKQIKESTLSKVPSATSADHAATSDAATTVGGLTAPQLKDRCPAGTVLYEGSCFETAQRQPAGVDWKDASRECEGVGRRLPDASELTWFASGAGVPFAGFEWTSDFEDAAHVMTIDDNGDPFLDQGGQHHPFRCVASLSN